MNKTAEIVRLWADYEASHPGAEIEEFCQFLLIRERERKEKKVQLGGNIPPDVYSQMAKMLGRLTKLHLTYAIPELKACGIKSFDEFMYLNTIANQETPKKTAVISSNFSELSSGLLILERLGKKGYVTEEDDSQDKRSKRLSLTEKGKNVLHQCYAKLREVNQLFFQVIPDEDIALCIQLLNPLELTFSKYWLEHKGKSLEEVKQLLGSK